MHSVFIEVCEEFNVGSELAIWAVEVANSYDRLIEEGDLPALDDAVSAGTAYGILDEVGDSATHSGLIATVQGEVLRIDTFESVNIAFYKRFLSELSVKSERILVSTYCERSNSPFPGAFSGGAIRASPDGTVRSFDSRDWLSQQ